MIAPIIGENSGEVDAGFAQAAPQPTEWLVEVGDFAEVAGLPKLARVHEWRKIQNNYLKVSKFQFLLKQMNFKFRSSHPAVRLKKLLTSQRAFTLWVGYGVPPFLFGMIAVAFFTSRSFGVVTASVVALWCAYTLNTTCRRCPFFGTSKCPVPGRIGSLFLSPKSLDSISIKQVKIHYFIDLLMIAYANYVYWHFAPLFPVVVFGTIGALLIVYIPRRHHGLLFLLRKPQARENR